ncbi:MAG TPA: ABC transporter permease [Myxococcaceae bacterium]
MDTLLEDIRFAARILRKNPGFTAVAILTLTLAIGANTAIFSVVNGVLLRPLPFPEPERLFFVVRQEPSRDTAPLSMPQYLFLASQPQPFSRLMAYPVVNSGFNLRGEGLPERVLGASVTQPFFGVLGVPPALGRDFLPEEDRVGGPRVVVLGHDLWQQRFSGRADILGQTLILNSEPHTVVGVAPPGFNFPPQAQLWTPLQLDPATRDTTHYLTVVGRLQPGVDPAQVSARLKAQTEQLLALDPRALLPENQLSAMELKTLATRATRPALLVLLGAVGVVLLIACVNLANLQIARATTRERELALRTALGASPGRLARQLLTESVLLSGTGGLLGLVLARVSLPALLALAPGGIPSRSDIGVDGAVLAFTFGVSVFAGLLFGVLPAWQASRLEPRGALQVSALNATTGVKGRLTRKLLVVSEVALSVVLLIGAALLAKSFALLREVSPGMDTRGVLTMKLALPEGRYARPEQLEAFTQRVVERVRSLPGVEAAGFALTLPFETGPRLDMSAPDGALGEGWPQDMRLVHYRPVTRGYFEALKIGLVRGRLVDDLDRQASAPVAVINETAARLYFAGKEPLGQRVLLGRAIPFLTEKAPREIIGVVRDVPEQGMRNGPPPILYIPLGQISPTLHARFIRLAPQRLVIRAPGAPPRLFEDIQREVLAVDAQQSVELGETMEELVSRQLAPERFSTLLMGLMAGLALGLAAIGVYGVLSYMVSQRARELAVRMALGATRAQVVWLVVRQGLVPVGAGMVLGVAGALGLTRLLAQLLYSVSPLDASAFIAALGVLLAVALTATLLPAVRASRVDIMETLRTE